MEISNGIVWFLIGVVFIVAELVLPGFIIIFFGVGCWIAALSFWIFKVNMTTQIIVFIVSSLVLLFALRRYSMKTFTGASENDVDDNYRDSKIGKNAVVTKEITPHLEGEIKFMGSFWRATADTQIGEGDSVVIEAQEQDDSLLFKVKAL